MAKSVRISQDQEQSAEREGKRAFFEKQIMDQACLLFARVGFVGTTLADIADAVNLTRGAIYYYFRSKEELLDRIVGDVTAMPLNEIAEWRLTAPKAPSERLRSFVKMRIHGVLGRQIRMQMIQVTEAALSPDILKRHLDAKRRILAEYRDIIQSGIRAGAFRAQDDRIAALGIIGMVNWTVSWVDADRQPDVAAIAAQLADMAVQSVAIPPDRKAGFTDVGAAIATLRSDLDQLSALVSGNKGKAEI